MSQPTVAPPYRFDPDDPRAPTVEQWAALTDPERRAVVAMLPSEFAVDEAAPPEGDAHRTAKELATDALSSFFERTGRRIYVSAELPVYYPGERMFAPDVIAVADVEPHPRQSWMVSHEGKGLDFILEILVSGRRRKDLVANPARYARLGVAEYFVLDLGRQALWGWHRVDAGGPYHPVTPARGMLPSRVLGLELSLIEGRLRFFFGPASVLQSRELIGQLEQAVAEQTLKREEEARSLQEALSVAETQLAEESRLRAEESRLRAEESRLRAEESRLRAEAEARAAREQERAAREQERAAQERQQRQGAEERLVEALAEIERLRRGRDEGS